MIDADAMVMLRDRRTLMAFGVGEWSTVEAVVAHARVYPALAVTFRVYQ